MYVERGGRIRSARDVGFRRECDVLRGEYAGRFSAISFPVIRPLDPMNDSAACDAIVASLPRLVRDRKGYPRVRVGSADPTGLVAEVDGEVTGFLTVARP